MEKLVLIDGYSMMYRAYYALNASMNAPDGTPTSAIHSFFMMLMKVIADERPDGLAVAFDMHAPTFRAKLYDGYKATRKPMPDDLREQDPIIRQLITMMEIPILEKESYEADDILGTVSLLCENSEREAVLVTGDRDSFQLSGPHTTILYTRKGITDTVRVTPDYIRETYGVEPKQMIDVKSLMGDTSDNIPGIAGIGEKTALKLIQTYGDLEHVLSEGAAKEKGKLKERLTGGRESAEMSRTLAEIVRNVPITPDFDAWKIGQLMNAVPRLRELGMFASIKRLEEVVALLAPEKTQDAVIETGYTPRRVESLDEFSEALKGAGKCLAVYFGNDVAVSCESADILLALGGGDLLTPGITEADAAAQMAPFVQSGDPVCVYNVKGMPAGMPGKAFDVMLAAYVLDPQRPSFAADALCTQAGISGFDVHPAHAIYDLAARQRQQLIQNGTEKILTNIEMPLAYVLRNMEDAGFKVNVDELRRLGSAFETEIDRNKREIFDIFGQEINLNSPKQLGEILFERLQLPMQKKKAKGYSTDAATLEKLAADYPVCAKILEYRKYQKLRSTYIDALIALRDCDDRVHTRFDQVATATGRLSSNEPNLQNIPVRTEVGKQIRGAFVADKGNLLIDADYSQIELRVLAHIADDKVMIDAFNADQDIHARTAAEVYGIPVEQVTHEMRSACKAVNFGIVYGISDFTLAQNIGVSRAEAKQFIERYFERYSGVQQYMKESVELARKKGYAETLLGRRRYLPDLHSSNFNVRSFGERCAMNSPIQGTAADIIKLAMLRTDEALKKAGMKAKLILQVHDELILEAPEQEAEAAAALLKETMENVLSLKVPLKAEVSIGGDWRACK